MVKEDDITETASNFSFQKLRGFENYKPWAVNFLRALQAIRLHKFILPPADNPAPTTLILSAEQEKEIAWISAAERREEKHELHMANMVRVQALMLKMVVASIAKEWESTHTDNTSPYDLWKWLKDRYTEGNVVTKWSVITDVEKMTLSSYKNIDQYRSKYYDLAHQIDDLKITFKDALMLQVLNNLGPEYNQFMAVLTSEVCNKPDNLDPEYIWKALEQEEKQAAVRNKQQANAATIGKNNKGGNNKGGNNKGDNSRVSSSDKKPNVCKSCGIPHKTGPGIVCHDKEKTCEECDATGHQKKHHNRWSEANKKPKDGNSQANPGSDKATKNVTCCITTPYASELPSSRTMPITNVARLHGDTGPPPEKLVIDSGTVTVLKRSGL